MFADVIMLQEAEKTTLEIKHGALITSVVQSEQ